MEIPCASQKKTGADIACDMEVQFDSNGGDHLETKQTKIDAWIENVVKLLK